MGEKCLLKDPGSVKPPPLEEVCEAFQDVLGWLWESDPVEEISMPPAIILEPQNFPLPFFPFFNLWQDFL